MPYDEIALNALDHRLLGALLSNGETGAFDIVSELLLVSLKLFHHDTMCVSSLEAAVKQAIHGFERDTLCLWHQEEDEDDTAKHEGGEQEEKAVIHGLESLWGKTRDDEVPEPVGRGCECLT